jgi:hypothetical protein
VDAVHHTGPGMGPTCRRLGSWWKGRTRVVALGFGGVGSGLVHWVDGEEVGPRVAARLVVDREHGRENGGRGRQDRRDWVKPTWLPRWMEEREGRPAGIQQLTAAERRRRTAANRSEARTPAASGGQGEAISRLGSEGGDATAAGGAAKLAGMPTWIRDGKRCGSRARA